MSYGTMTILSKPTGTSCWVWWEVGVRDPPLVLGWLWDGTGGIC
jgi:hypothetical protein